MLKKDTVQHAIAALGEVLKEITEEGFFRDPYAFVCAAQNALLKEWVNMESHGEPNVQETSR